jgi:nucleotide-binding universal stress UspA family protein
MERIMHDEVGCKPVVVGIDGSDAAIHAAEWAIAEAVSRDVPLRLVAVTKFNHPSAEDYHQDIRHAEAALRTAQDAVGATNQPVKVETAMISGLPNVSLIEESRDAAMVCVGSVGIGRYAREILGSVALDLAEKALCPVAIVRAESQLPRRVINWVLVVGSDEPANDSVMTAAFKEAQLRRAPILVLGTYEGCDERVKRWKCRYPGVHAYAITESATVTHFLNTHDDGIELAVIGPAEAKDVAQILGRHGHSRFHRTVASVLIVR